MSHPSPHTTSPDLPYWLALTFVKGLGSRSLLRLVSACGSARAAWEAPLRFLDEIEATPTLQEALRTARRTVDIAAELAKVEQAGAHLVCYADAAYPANLRSIDAPPALLYVRGELTPEDDTAVTVVGTRSASAYGRDATFRLARELALQGVTIISGLAQGIDTAAHRGALAGSGRTLAVFACGIDRIYPAANASLAQEILSRRAGAWISEFALGAPPTRSHFPRRNLMMAGLARAVLVTEAPEGSGALITADHALEQGREVFALPANIMTSSGAGTNRLIQEGARLITGVEDILEELNVEPVRRPSLTRRTAPPRPHREEPPAQTPPPDLNEAERRLHALLRLQPQHIDDLIRASGMRADETISAMTLLELKGLAQMIGPMQYCLSQ